MEKKKRNATSRNVYFITINLFFATAKTDWVGKGEVVNQSHSCDNTAILGTFLSPRNRGHSPGVEGLKMFYHRGLLMHS